MDPSGMADDFDDPPKPKKGKWVKDPHAQLEERVRSQVLRSSEDWLTAKHVSQTLRVGIVYVHRVMAEMVAEGVLTPLQHVPMSNDPRVKIGRRPIEDGSYDVTAFVHDGKWVIGYFSKSAADARRTVLVHGRPKMDHYGWSRVRIKGLTRQRTPTPAMREKFEKSFRYKLADWDGTAHFLLRSRQPYASACLAVGIEPMTDLPWTCECGRKNEAGDNYCSKYECNKPKPKLLHPPKPKVCERCGEPDVDGHSRRHRGRQNAKSKRECLEKMVDAVHKM